LIAVGFLVLSVFLIWSGHVYASNWLLGTPPPWVVDMGTVAILVVYLAFFAFVKYMQARQRAQEWGAAVDRLGPPDGPGEQAEPSSTATVLPFALTRPPPPAQPIPRAPAARANGDAS
jgi:hypothetical protein